MDFEQSSLFTKVTQKVQFIDRVRVRERKEGDQNRRWKFHVVPRSRN